MLLVVRRFPISDAIDDDRSIAGVGVTETIDPIVANKAGVCGPQCYAGDIALSNPRSVQAIYQL
jgi:hypothetical protein